MTNLNIDFIKCRDVKTPCKAHPTDAGIDFYIPSDINAADITEMYSLTQSYCNINYSADGFVKSIIVPGHSSVLIPTGIKTAIPKGWCLTFFNKSGIATKRHLVVGSCVVDSDYRGEICINLINSSDAPSMLVAGDKIVQGLLMQVPEVTMHEVDTLDDTLRGAGGFGSTGDK